MGDDTSEHWEQLERLFHESIALAGDAREDFVVSACEGRPELLDELRQLLDSHDGAAEEFLVNPEPETRAATGSAPSAPPSGELAAGQVLGSYRIVRRIATGGMGTVYEAQQSHPERRVALKVMRAGLFAPGSIRRFEYESEVLGRLRHHGVAQVHEAGTFEQGGLTLPWFAMELIEDAQPITGFVRRNTLAMDERLELLASVCDAVHHGHQKGVLHRDLKPDNVLVDGNGLPKIIDFGVARMMDADAQLTTMRTAAGELIGTLAYMSPEQCGGTQDEIDIRSDVYALGVLLYEVLVGQHPYEITGRTLPDAVRVIQEDPPQRMSGLGDIEAITLKALEKNPARRYQSAAELSADLRRFLRNEPVAAKSPSFTYHLRLFARRHRGVMAATAAVVVVLAAGVVVSSWFAIQASNRAEDAENARGEVERSLAEAEDARDAMDVERKTAFQMLSFLENLLASANPIFEKGDLTVRELLDRAEARLGNSFQDRPAIRGRLLITIADAHRGLGHFPAAQRIANEALGLLEQSEEDTRASRSAALSILGIAQMKQHDFDGADESLRESLDLRRELFGENHELVASALSKLGSVKSHEGKIAESEEFLRRSLTIRKSLGAQSKGTQPNTRSGDLEVAESVANLGTAFWQAGDAKKARVYFAEALAIYQSVGRTEHPFYAQILANHGLTLQRAREYEAAEKALLEALRIFAAQTGEQSASVASTNQKLGFLYIDTKDIERADAAFRRALLIRRTLFGPKSNAAAAILTSIGYLHISQGNFERALPALREAAEIQRKLLAKDDLALAGTLLLFGRALLGSGDAKSAEPELTRAVQIRSKLGPGHYQFGTAQSALGECRSVLGRHRDAEPLLLSSFPVIERFLGPNHVETATARRRIAEMYDRWKRPGEARKWR